MGVLLNNSELIEKLITALERVIKGKRSFLEDLVCAYLAGGHVLLEDYPGLGKTTVAKALAALISEGGTRRKGSSFRRIQFTPDLLPYDITGVEVFNPDTKKFKFAQGPVFAQVVLADEINRAGPKVQSALLEVMAEHQVTVGNKSYPMDDLFFVMATQNPLEIEGTYLLPLAQMDRFIMRLSLGYPDLEAEIEILTANPSEKELPLLKPVLKREELLSLRAAVETVYCAPELVEAAARAASLSRNHKNLHLGISPRGVLHLLQAARSRALLKGRDYVVDQDLLDLCESVWAHRIRGREAHRAKGLTPRELILEGLKQTPKPSRPRTGPPSPGSEGGVPEAGDAEVPPGRSLPAGGASGIGSSAAGIASSAVTGKDSSETTPAKRRGRPRKAAAPAAGK